MTLDYSYKRRLGGVAITIAMLAGVQCGDDGSGHASIPDSPDTGTTGGPTLLDKTTDRAVVKVRPRAGGWIALEEQLAPWNGEVIDRDRRRALVWKASTPDGANTAARFTPAEGELISDFTVHPSGAATAVVTGTSPSDNRLVRFDAWGNVVSSTALTDPDLATDPEPFGQKMGISFPLQLRCSQSRMAASIEAVGEDLVVSFETGAHAVVLHRYRLGGSEYIKSWRRLVEPATYMLGFGGTWNMSTFDTADHEAGAHRATLVVGENGIAVVVPEVMGPDSQLGYRAPAHNAYFGSEISESLEGAVLVTLYSRDDGTRMGFGAVGGFFDALARGAAMVGDTVYVVGAGGTPNADGFGLDARIAAVDMGAMPPWSHWETNIDFHRSDWLMDVVPTKSGHLLATGMSGFWRNAGGVSFGEESESLVAELDQQGKLLRRISLPPAPRNNQVRSVALADDAVLAGVLSNGPGTHSGDNDLTRVKADGEVWRLSP